MKPSPFAGLLLFAVASAMATPATAAAPSSSPTIISHRSSESASTARSVLPPAAIEHARRIAHVNLDLELLLEPAGHGLSRAARGFVSGGTFEIELFPGERYQVQGRRVEEGFGTASTWIGDIVGGETGTVAITQSGTSLYGFAEIGLKRYEFQGSPTGHVLATEVDQASSGICLDSIITEEPSSKEVAASGETAPSAMALSSLASPARTFDIIILYTPAVATTYGDPSAMANGLVAQLNQSFINSGVDAGARVVHYAQRTISAEPSTGAQFVALTTAMKNGTGDFTFLPALRNTMAADLVVLLVQSPSGAETCGYAPALTTDMAGSTAQSLAFAVVSVNCPSTDLTFTHEVGHLLGGRHDRASYQAVPTSVYDIGYGFTNRNAPFRTIMGSLSLTGFACNMAGCPRINRWSDARNTYNVGGVDYDLGSYAAADRSDMVLTMNGGTDWDTMQTYNGTIPTVVAHRTPSSSAPGTPSAITSTYMCGLGYPLAWSAVTGTVGWYELEHSSTSSFASPKQIYRGSQRAHSYQFKPGMTNYFRVRACNALGCSAYSPVRGPAAYVGC